MKKVPSEAGEIHKYNYRVVNNKMVDFEENFFGARHVPFISSHKKGGNFDINNKVLHIEHTVNLYYHQQCSAGHLLCMVKCHCKCPLHVCIMARLSLLLAKEILSTFCLLSFWLPYFWNGRFVPSGVIFMLKAILYYTFTRNMHDIVVRFVPLVIDHNPGYKS